MTPEVLVLVLAALLAVPLAWVVPARWALDAVAVWAALVLALIAPAALIWLVAAAVGTTAVLRLMQRSRRPGALVLIWSGVLVGALLALREGSPLQLIGAAYFTLRALHVLLDGWMGRLPPPGLRDMLRYQLFLPVLLAGPINRYQGFARSLARRRFEVADLANGAERALFGLAMALILGQSLIGEVLRLIDRFGPAPGGFWRDWLASALDWVQLYFTFAGYSSFAIGTALMIGIRVEENFRRPWAARNLIEFWTRWHVTLSMWCRDYVFQPVTAASRSPVLGLAAAMLVIGLWHETSPYYVLWSLWQVTGMVGNRVLLSRATGLSRLPWATRLAPLWVLGWLSLARPVLTRLLGIFA